MIPILIFDHVDAIHLVQAYFLSEKVGLVG